MNNLGDFHIHSTFSDGQDQLYNILEEYYQKGFKAISITDHDTIDAYIELPSHYKNSMRIVKGVEISSRYAGREVHILGYDYDVYNGRLVQLLRELKHSRLERAKKMIKKLVELDLSIDLEDVLKIVGQQDIIGRPHIAQALVNNGHITHSQQAFNKYIGDKGPAYVPKIEVSPKEVIDIIHDADGFAVLAHPFKSIDMDNFSYFAKAGIDGIETYYYDHKKKEVRLCESLCRDYDLVSTGGSDYHGKLKHQVMGSYSSPMKVIDDLNKYLKEKIVIDEK